MKSAVILITFLVSLAGSAAAQQPDWIANNGISASYPDKLFITGFGVGEGESVADRTGLAEQNARTDLSAKFIVRIQSELVSHEVESKGKYYGDFRNTASSQTQLNLVGVDIQRYDDARNKRCCALAVMDIQAAYDAYSRRLGEIADQLAALIRSAEQAEKNNDTRLAIIQYRKTFPLFIELGETGTIIQILRGRAPFTISADVGKYTTVIPVDIESRINTLLNENITSTVNAAVSIAVQLHEQLADKIPVTVYPLTYRDTDFSSHFSAAFLPILEKELVPYYTVVSQDAFGAHGRRTVNCVTGSYWVENDEARLIVYITDLKNGSKLAAASVNFPAAVAEKEGIELQPRNFQQAMEDSKVFLKQDVIPGTLSLEVWTSKGDRSLLFKANEETQIFVRVNKPCYLQVLYHMANGVRLLLYNNLYLDISKVNQVFTLPDTFYFAPPLGVERLQVFAGTEKFDNVRIKTATFEGETYDNVLVEDFEKHTVAMRGIKKKDPGKEMTERIISITTIP